MKLGGASISRGASTVLHVKACLPTKEAAPAGIHSWAHLPQSL